MGPSSFKFVVQCTPKDAPFLQECVLAGQGHSRSSKVHNFGTNRSAYATSY